MHCNVTFNKQLTARSDASTLQLSLLVLAGQLGENCFNTYIKAPYPYCGRNGFFLLLILLAYTHSSYSSSSISILYQDLGRLIPASHWSASAFCVAIGCWNRLLPPLSRSGTKYKRSSWKWNVSSFCSILIGSSFSKDSKSSDEPSLVSEVSRIWYKPIKQEV